MFSFALRDGLELRLVEERHAEAIFAEVDRNRAHLREWLAWVDGTTGPESTLIFIRKTLAQFAANEGFAAGIWRGQELLGVAGFLPIDWANRKVEMGYWLGREHQGNGYIHAAGRALIQHALTEWKLNRIEVRCAGGNLPSIRVAERLGFQREGTLRSAHSLYGTYHDLHIYGLLAREWHPS